MSADSWTYSDMGLGPGDVPMWVVYDHPSDHPLVYVARLWKINPAGSVDAGSYMVAPTLDMIQGMMRVLGLTRLDRADDDDPTIVEVWL